VIGTHRLLQPDVEFRDLGLLVVDEEQRFGVRQKERLKELKRNVDVLAMTATPIPRTLHLSLAGLRDVSLIQTPPRDRMPIITHVVPWIDEVIGDAILRELDRGGQVFVVHNRIESLGTSRSG
jgi:transcription-repair coupling factor (superfamily II helicase)